MTGTEDAAKQLVTSCVLSRLNYCNSLLMGTPNSDAESRKYCCTPHSQSSSPSKLHTSPPATPLAPNFWTNKIRTCLHVLQRNHRFRSLLSFWTATPLQSFPLSPLFVRHACSKSGASTAKPMAFTLWPPHLEQSPLRHQATLSSFKSKLKTFLFSEYFS